MGRQARGIRGACTLAASGTRWETGGGPAVAAPDAKHDLVAESRISTFVMASNGHHLDAPRAQEPDVDVTTLAVDDHGAFRDALRQLIAAAQGFVLIGEACSGEEAVREVDRLLPRLVLMDVVMPGMGGIAATHMILRRHPGLVVVLISADDPALDAGVVELGGAVASARKQDLRPRGIRQLWETRAPLSREAAT